ncbi:FAD-dependent oxidoreductase [Desulfobacca acetoxidans]|uniref:CoA-disulfide reductase n=1 Tax=Desulfobacca acetoxidans (strain ATCC 700848 / DSM 11109 / ASRB2) TaxID=880072 RepID=F2NEN3_DESAR|nr:FAD-dependent oxidoreductase [Desulfobacca acetoxidans]AEB08223.1 CoA-disulfide reductase [Desulfobacca acetoxidans DSM 11109]
MACERILIIGGGVLGPKVACRLKRLKPEWDVTVIDQQEEIAYSACGIPYYISGDVGELQGLMTASFQMVRSPEFFEDAKDVRIKTRTQALALDRQAKQVRVRQVETGAEEKLSYDKLVLATGRRPKPLNVAGAELPGVVSVATLMQAEAVKRRISQGEVAKAVIIGASPRGLEMTAAVSDLWGVETTLVEPGSQVLPGLLDVPLARMVQYEVQCRGVQVFLEESVQEILAAPGEHSLEVITSTHRLPADLVIVALGAEPRTELAVSAGLLASPNGGLLVNQRLQTSDPDIYAGGGCIEYPHLLTGKTIYFPETSLAHRQGRVIGTNIAGGYATFPDIVGSFTLKVFDLGVAGTGLTLETARNEGLTAEAALVVQQDHAHFYPTQELIYLQLVVDSSSRRLLGAQGISPNGDAVVGRVNSIAALLGQHGNLEDLAHLEVAYSPPYATALDIVNTVANTAENLVTGFNQSISLTEFQRLFLEEARDDVICLDVRGAANAAPFVARFPERWLNIPQETLKYRFKEVPRDKRLILICNAGMRSYEALRQLQTQGFDNAVGLQGGVAALKKAGILTLE